MERKGIASVARAVVIVVDDDPAVRNSLKFSLELEGYSVRAYARATDLLDSSDINIGTCFVIDQKMPGMTGLDLIAKLRAKDVQAPAILITTHPGAIIREIAASADVPIVEKPLLGNTLIDRIRGACGQDGTSQQ